MGQHLICGSINFGGGSVKIWDLLMNGSINQGGDINQSFLRWNQCYFDAYAQNFSILTTAIVLGIIIGTCVGIILTFLNK